MGTFECLSLWNFVDNHSELKWKMRNTTDESERLTNIGGGWTTPGSGNAVPFKNI